MKYRYSWHYEGELKTMTHSDKYALHAMVSEFMRKHNIKFSPESLTLSIERQSRLAAPLPKARKSLSDIIHGAKAIVRYSAGNAASNGEIKRRSSICAACPLKADTSGCKSCQAGGKLAALVSDVRNKKKIQMEIPSEVKDKYCEVCGCSLLLMIVTKYADFYDESDEKNQRRPDCCWLKKTSPNFTHE